MSIAADHTYTTQNTTGVLTASLALQVRAHSNKTLILYHTNYNADTACTCVLIPLLLPCTLIYVIITCACIITALEHGLII